MVHGDRLKYVCINCGKGSATVFHKYCSTVLKLTECDYCGHVVDKYVEYDEMLIVLDLILQRITAYRHMLVNAKFKNYGRVTILFLLCDAYNKWIEMRSKDFPNNSTLIYDLEWRFYQCGVQSLLETVVFLVAIMLARFMLCGDRDIAGIKFVAARTMAGFYGNVLVVLAIVWQLHLTWSYVILTKLFIFISQIQTQRVVTYHGSVVEASLAVTFASLSQYLVKAICDSNLYL